MKSAIRITLRWLPASMASSGAAAIPAACITSGMPSSRTFRATRRSTPRRSSARVRRRRAADWNRAGSRRWDRSWNLKSKRLELSRTGLSPKRGAMGKAKIVDSHVHFWELSKGWNTALEPHMTILLTDQLPQHLEPHLKAAGVDQIVVVEGAETVLETHFQF